ncbi:unnamed protein product [Acanthosepion pharaonis]|uniref:NADH dehydrogenase subunit 2 n=1 Tax=Acanthosepion pharaonis TaxID=158019 RepID=A0A812EBX6_ACAPH|nr:unnamed protein product [Sepia pharaonis]
MHLWPYRMFIHTLSASTLSFLSLRPSHNVSYFLPLSLCLVWLNRETESHFVHDIYLSIYLSITKMDTMFKRIIYLSIYQNCKPFSIINAITPSCFLFVLLSLLFHLFLLGKRQTLPFLLFSAYLLFREDAVILLSHLFFAVTPDWREVILSFCRATQPLAYLAVNFYLLYFVYVATPLWAATCVYFFLSFFSFFKIFSYLLTFSLFFFLSSFFVNVFTLDFFLFFRLFFFIFLFFFLSFIHSLFLSFSYYFFSFFFVSLILLFFLYFSFFLASSFPYFILHFLTISFMLISFT